MGDRRKCYRHPLSWFVVYHPEGGEPVLGQALDISLTGISILTATPFPRNTPLKLYLVAAGQRIEIKANASVVYSSQHHRLELYQTGVNFEVSNPGSLREMAELLIGMNLFRDAIAQ